MSSVRVECHLNALKVRIVRGDVLDFGCDGIVSGPPRQRNPAARLFPNFVWEHPEPGWGRVIIEPNDRCPREWTEPSKNPVLVASPPESERLRFLAIFNPPTHSFNWEGNVAE